MSVSFGSTAPAINPEEHLGLLFTLAKRQAARYGLRADEFTSVAWENLLNAAAKFDPERGFRFSSYAGMAITRGIINAHRKENLNNLRSRLSWGISEFRSLDEVRGMAIDGDASPLDRQEQARERLQALIDAVELSDDEQAVLALWQRGSMQRHIADHLNRSRKWVSDKQKAIAAKLREAAEAAA